MIGALMGHSVDIVRHGVSGRDALGKEIKGEVSRQVAVPCSLEQRTTDEDGAYVVDAWVGFFHPGTDVRSGDEVHEGTRIFQVEGSPADRLIPGFPGADHVSVNLKYVGEVS